MIKYLKPKQHYIDIYDSSTIKDCRWREYFHKNSKPSGKLPKEVTEKFFRGVTEMALHYDLLYATIGWYENKEKRVNETMERDRQRDEVYEKAKAPTGIRCLKCHSLMSPDDKILYDLSDSEDRVLFMYDCPSECMPRRSFFDDGEEYKIKPRLCPKCDFALDRKSERMDGDKVITTETCPNCNHVEVEEMDLSIKKEEPDPNYEIDKERFCLSGKRLMDNLEEKRQLEDVARIVDKWKEKEEHKEEYDYLKDIKKLTVVALENLLIPVCEKSKFIKFQLGTPDMGKDLIIPFTAHDSEPDRTDLVSYHELQKIIKKALEDTNWRLMSEGISYRMGILSGRLRAYEREEDLLELAKKRLKKS